METITLDQYTSKRDLNKVVSEQIGSIRSGSVRRVMEDLMTMYAKTTLKPKTKSRMTFGITYMPESELKQHRMLNNQIDIWLTGVLVIDPQISPDLVKETIKKCHIAGMIVAPREIKELLYEKMY